MDAKPSLKVRIARRFAASPQRVFDAWLDSRTAGRWLFATTGHTICAEIDARAGGWFYIVERRNGENVEYMGEFLEAVRPHRLVFTLLAEKCSLEFERVTVVLDPHGTGCDLGLIHETRPESAQQVRRHWIGVLDGLATMLGERDRDRARGEIAVSRAAASHC